MARSLAVGIWSTTPPTMVLSLRRLLTLRASRGWTIGDKHTPGGLGEISYFFIGVLLGSPTVTGTWTQATFSVTATGSDTFEIQFGINKALWGLTVFP